ncbi:hypothetical protein DFH06DRAFT_1057715, partial [Mycena polygramma]
MTPPISFTFPGLAPPASLTRLTESNAAPSSIESQLTMGYIDELETQVASLDEAVASILRRRTDILRSVEAHKVVFSPIRRVPPEILGEIFSSVVHATFHFGDISQVKPPVSRHAPWLLTRVCRHWAAVALETPALWSMVFLDLDSMGQHGAVSMTELCLQRSRNMPLNVKIFCHGHESHAVLDAATSASNRWKHAYISILFPLAFQLRSIRGRLSALTTLDISFDLAEADMIVDENDSFWSILADAPRLTTLITHCWDLECFLRTPFTLPWHQLTRLSTTFTSNTEALSMLRRLSNIVECKLAFDRNEVLQSDLAMKTHLPHLRFLALQIETEHPPQLIQLKHTSVLDFLSTPSLRDLETIDTADEESVLGLVTRSDCAASLKSLRFHSR